MKWRYLLVVVLGVGLFAGINSAEAIDCSEGNINIGGGAISRKRRRPAVYELTLISERLDGCQYDNGDHQHRRYLIDDTEEFLSVPVAVVAEFARPMPEQAVHHGQGDNQDKLCNEPAGREPLAFEHQHDADHPGDDHRRQVYGQEYPTVQLDFAPYVEWVDCGELRRAGQGDALPLQNVATIIICRKKYR